MTIIVNVHKDNGDDKDHRDDHVDDHEDDDERRQSLVMTMKMTTIIIAPGRAVASLNMVATRRHTRIHAKRDVSKRGRRAVAAAAGHGKSRRMRVQCALSAFNVDRMFPD
jgi:hypothetical protein